MFRLQYLSERTEYVEHARYFVEHKTICYDLDSMHIPARVMCKYTSDWLLAKLSRIRMLHKNRMFAKVIGFSSIQHSTPYIERASGQLSLFACARE